MQELPLKGIMVLDFSWVIAGPHCGRLLADLGATVIKVESSRSVDQLRRDTMRRGADELTEGGWGFQDNNRNKLGLRMNIKTLEGEQIFHELVKKADAVHANLGARTFRKMGLSYETLKEINPRIITINASGLGNFGPYADYATFAPIIHSIAGITSQIGYREEGRPYGYNGIIADYLGGLFEATAILAAIQDRERTGCGQFIDLSQCETTMLAMTTNLLDYQVNGRKHGVNGDRDVFGNRVPHNCYRACGEDSWVALSVDGEREWTALCSMIPALQGRRDVWNTPEARLADEDTIDAVIAAWMADKEAKTVERRLQAAGVSAACVQDNVSTMADECLNSRHYFAKLPIRSDFEPSGLVVTRCQTSTDLTDSGIRKSAPPMGADNAYILKEILHLSEEQIAFAEKAEAFV